MFERERQDELDSDLELGVCQHQLVFEEKTEMTKFGKCNFPGCCHSGVDSRATTMGVLRRAVVFWCTDCGVHH